MAGLKRPAVIPLRTAYIRCRIPEVADQSEHPQTHPVKCQDGKASALVHSIKRLLEVGEDAKEWCLLQMGKLLAKFCLDYPRPRASPGKAAMEAVVENDLLQPNIHDLLQNLPNRFEEPDAPILPSSFWVTQSLPSTFAEGWYLLPKRTSRAQ